MYYMVLCMVECIIYNYVCSHAFGLGLMREVCACDGRC